jgi:hypothetical protein
LVAKSGCDVEVQLSWDVYYGLSYWRIKVWTRYIYLTREQEHFLTTRDLREQKVENPANFDISVA